MQAPFLLIGMEPGKGQPSILLTVRAIAVRSCSWPRLDKSADRSLTSVSCAVSQDHH